MRYVAPDTCSFHFFLLFFFLRTAPGECSAAVGGQPLRTTPHVSHPSSLEPLTVFFLVFQLSSLERLTIFCYSGFLNFLSQPRFAGTHGGLALDGILPRPEVAQAVVPANSAEDAVHITPPAAVHACRRRSSALRARPSYPLRQGIQSTRQRFLVANVKQTKK